MKGKRAGNYSSPRVRRDSEARTETRLIPLKYYIVSDPFSENARMHVCLLNVLAAKGLGFYRRGNQCTQ